MSFQISAPRTVPISDRSQTEPDGGWAQEQSAHDGFVYDASTPSWRVCRCGSCRGSDRQGRARHSPDAQPSPPPRRLMQSLSRSWFPGARLMRAYAAGRGSAILSGTARDQPNSDPSLECRKQPSNPPDAKRQPIHRLRRAAGRLVDSSPRRPSSAPRGNLLPAGSHGRPILQRRAFHLRQDR